MTTTALKVAGAALALAAVAGGGAAVFVAVRPLWQGDPANAGRLGVGSSTIADGGCLLTCLTMAANALHRTALEPKQVNALLVDAGAFVGSLIDVEKALPPLRLRLVRRERPVFDASGRVVSRPDKKTLRAVVDDGLKRGGLAIVNVDHNGDGRGDHFALVHGRARDGTYAAADPAPAKTVTLSRDLGGVVRWGQRDKTYDGVGAFSFVRAT